MREFSLIRRSRIAVLLGNSRFTMLKTLKRQIGLAFFYIKNLAHSLKTFVDSSI